MKINVRVIVSLMPIFVGLLMLPLAAPSVQASEVDFVCGGTASPFISCVGSISAVFSNSTTLTSASDAATPISVVNSQGPELGVTFSLFFDTTAAAPNILLTNGVETLSGTILMATGFQAGSENDVDLSVDWTSLPADFAAFLGTASGTGITTNVFLSSDSLDASTDVSITPAATPEPASLLLIGTGLVSLGGLLRRRVFGS